MKLILILNYFILENENWNVFDGLLLDGKNKAFEWPNN